MEIGQYKIIEKIGEGGMGVIYKAEHSTLQQIVAIKALPSSLSSNSDIRERFVREATIQAKITHPNIVNIHNFFEFKGNYYIVMEYVEGETLEEMIKRSGLIPPDRCVSLFEQIATGIQYAHEKGIIHRDIKPSNVMVNSQGNVKIMDFGIAKIAGGLNLTNAGVKVGTVWYMSPEQVKGYSATVTTDVYSLGVTLFEMVTGRVPFHADSEYNVMKDIVESPPSSPKLFYPYMPDFMEHAILKALAKCPEDRFQSVKEFSAALTDKQYSPVTAQFIGAPEQKLEYLSALKKIVISRNQLIWAGTGLLIICVLLIISMLRIRTDASVKSVVSSVGEEIPTVVVPNQSSLTGSEKVVVKTTSAEKVIAGNSNNGDAEAKKVKEKIAYYINKGKQYHEDGKFSEARGVYKKVLQLDVNNNAARSGIIDANQAEKALSAR